MQRFNPLGGPFARVHAAFTLDGLEIDWDAMRSATYRPREREAGRKAFLHRALDEQRSLVAFAELLRDFCEAGAPVDVIGAMTRIVRDEAAHVDLCTRAVEALGGWPSDAPEPKWVKADGAKPVRQRILRAVVGSLCVGETISVAMIGGVREHTSDAEAHKILTKMLADESYHSRFGWWWLEENAQHLSNDERRWLDMFLVRAFESVERSARPTREARLRTFRPNPFGAMPTPQRDAAFLDAIHQKILPAFERFGIGATAAWNQRKSREEYDAAA